MKKKVKTFDTLSPLNPQPHPFLHPIPTQDKKEKKTKKKKEKTEDKAEEGGDDAGAPAAEEPKKAKRATSNVFALFNQSQIQEFKEVGIVVVGSDVLNWLALNRTKTRRRPRRRRRRLRKLPQLQRRHQPPPQKKKLLLLKQKSQRRRVAMCLLSLTKVRSRSSKRSEVLDCQLMFAPFHCL